MTLSKTLLALTLLLVSGVAGAAPAKATKAPVRKVVLAVDGLSYDAFKEAQRRGLFAEFKNHGAHIAPFPTMTDLSWATMTRTAEIFGDAGRIKNVEATYFDESTQSIQGDPRDYYQRLAFPKYYLGAFEAVFNPYVEALVYFPTNEVPKMELKSVIDQVLASRFQNAIMGYLGSVDSTAHTQLNRLHPLLVTLDSEIKRLNKEFKERGEEVEVILVSDHGNVGRFKEGTAESELVGIEISKTVERAGLRFVSQLKESKDVAMPLLALGTWGPVYFKDRKNRDLLLQAFRQESWFDLAMVVNRNNARETIMTVTSATGAARIHLDKKSSLISYYPVQGNPLQLPERYHSTQSAVKSLTSAESVAASRGTPYPDALFRLVESASDRNFDFPDMIVTLKDGYFIQNALGGFTKMYRTHGSLTRASSQGLFASNRRSVPSEIRTQDILPSLGIDAKDLFQDRARWHNASSQEALSEMNRNQERGVETKARDFSEYRIFRLLSRFISDTRSYFLVSEMSSFMKAFKSNPLQSPGSSGLSPMNFDISQFDMNTMLPPEDIGFLTDAVLTAGSLENFLKDPRVEEIKNRISLLKDVKTASLDKQTGDDGMRDSLKSYFLPAKRSVMKMYQMPYLLQNSLIVQEKPYLPDTRDLLFARQWESDRARAIRSKEALKKEYPLSEMSIAQKLFQEVRKEVELEDKIYPTPLAKAFNAKADGLTIVYVPGIYNSIFDKEIFSLGLQALKDDLGLRVIQPPVESTCSADVNGQKILNFVYQDMKNRVERQHKTPRYLFISYSKGAVDTLNFFTKYPGFVSTYVAGMVSVAAPLHGASILDKSDLPLSLVSALSEGEAPAVCRQDKTAASSLTPAAMDSFWRRHERSLIGLTRYFSVTFKSTPEDSHLFMRAAKLIAQFDEDNDGVVTVSSSKFPASLQAVDLGTVEADHLAGILSSNFNQKSFMKSLVNTVAELDVLNWQENFKWNTRNIVEAASTQGRFFTHKPSLKGLIYSNSWELNRQLLPPRDNPADSYETKIKLPSSQFRYDPDMTLDIQKMPDVMAKTRVTPATRQNMSEGIRIDYNHSHMVHFRMDHRFNYESRSPIGLDDNEAFGFKGVDFKGQPNWLMMRSQNNSIRMTTMAYRFSPLDFPRTELDLAVTKDVVGADSIKGKTGKDDSPFQVWFTVRVGNSGDRTLVDPKQDEVILFGYYWGSPVAGEVRPAGTIYENWYSNKNVVVATLPEAKQLLLNSPDMLGSRQAFRRNLAEDLARAFPNRRVSDMEILAITLQHDSNDTGTSSEAFFKSLRFLP